MNLLEKAKTITTPTAYSNGFVHSVKPEIVLGEELVANGTFDTDSDWLKTNAVIADGKATVTVVGGAFSRIFQSLTYTSGREYHIKALVQGLSGSNGKQIRFMDNGGNSGGLTTTNGTVTLDETLQSIEISWVANSNSNGVFIERNTSIGDYIFTIDNVSVKEKIDADFDFSRGSSATRRNELGYIEDVQIIGGELVSNGDFEEVGSELIVNGDFSATGPNIADESTIENAGGSVMTKLTTFTYNATSDGTGGSTVRPKLTFDDVVIGQSYILEIIPSNQSGTIDFKAYDGGGYYAYSDLSGNFKQFFTCRGVNTFIAFDGTTLFNVDFTISLTEVCQSVSLQNAGGTTGWRLTDNRTLRMDSEAFVKNRNVGFIGNTITAGKSYVLTLDIIDSNQSIVVYVGGVAHPEYLPTGTHYGYEYRFTSLGSGNLLLYGGTSKIQEIDNVSVKEVGQDWTFTNATINDGQVVLSPSANVNQNCGLITGRKYRVKYDILSINAGSSGVTPYVGSTGSGTRRTQVGTYTEDIVASGILSLYFFTGGGFVSGTIDNVSVKEVTDDTDLPRIN